MIFLVDLSQPDLFHGDLFPVLTGTFYILVEGRPSSAKVEQIKSAFPDLSLGTVKVVFVKSFAEHTLDKFAYDKGEHPRSIVDLRPTEWMLHTHLFPPSVSRAVIRSIPYSLVYKDLILKMILDTMCAIINGVRISADEFPVLAHIQDKFGEYLEIGDEFDENFDPYKHSVYCKPREHIWARMDSSGKFRWPIETSQVKIIKKVIDHISFEDLLHLADHEELVSTTYTTSPTPIFPKDDVLPEEIRAFVCSYAQTNEAFFCMTNDEDSLEFAWVKTCVTPGFVISSAIPLLIETRSDPRAQVSILSEYFEQIAPGGFVYFKHPDVGLTVMLSTWSTTVPVGSLYGNLSHVFENFAQFQVCQDGSLWIQKRLEDF
jgi:hypothetical protein